MKTLIALAGSLLVAGSASAVFTGVYAVDMQNPDQNEQTWRFYASFDNAEDHIGAYAGLTDQPFVFKSYVGGIINHDNATDHLDDLPFGTNTPNLDIDTWLTIGQIGGFVGFPSFSPEFLGTDYNDPANLIQVLVDGITEWSDENSSVFIPGPAALVTTWGDEEAPYDVALAQFTVPASGGAELVMDFAGVLQWTGPDEVPVQSYFEVTVPSPGALALLGLAGLIGRRRR